MKQQRHIVYINEFFHPDICASAAVLTEQLPRLVRLRDDLKITVIAGDRSWSQPQDTHPPRGEYDGVEIIRVPRPALRRSSLWSRGRGFLAFGRGVVRAARELESIDLVIGTTAPPHGGMIARRLANERCCGIENSRS